VATLAQALTDIIVQLCRERATTDPSGVGFYNAEHEAGASRTQPRTRRRGSTDSVGTGHEWIGAVINIQQHALRALEQDFRASLAHFLQSLPNRLRELLHEGCDFLQIIEQTLAVHWWLVESGTQRVMVRAQPVQLSVQTIQMR